MLLGRETDLKEETHNAEACYVTEFEAILLRSPQGIVSLITSFKDLHYFARRYHLNVADALKFELK